MKNRPAAGVSLVELMVVLTILGILLAVAAPSFADLLNRRRVQAVAEQISSDFAFARAETGLRPQSLSFYFDSNASMSCYTMAYFGTGAGCNCTNSGNACSGAISELKTTRVPTNIGVSFTSAGTWSSPLTVGRVIFVSPQMTTSPNNFNVTVSGVRGAQLRVVLNPLGRVSTCSPNNSINGVLAC